MSENLSDELKRLVHQRAELRSAEAYNQALGTPRNYPQALYFIQCGDLVKVGKSVDPEKRLKEFQTGAPGPLRLIAQFPNKGHLEHECHQQLEHLRVHGEWFRFDFEVNQLLKELSNDSL